MNLTILVASVAAVYRNVYIEPERGDSYGIQNDADSRQGY